MENMPNYYVSEYENSEESYPAHVFSASEKALNAGLEKVEAFLDKYVVSPLLGKGPVGAAADY
jgi:hypothetical protein